MGSIKLARASPPANPDSPSAARGMTKMEKMNRPMTMDGTPAITVERNRTTVASGLVPPYSCR